MGNCGLRIADCGIPDPGLTVLTVATHWQPGLRRFQASCRRQGVDPLILGYGQPWRGFGWRLRLLAEAADALRGRTLLYCDAYDSLLARPAGEILAAYHELGHPLVFGAEVVCWPDPALADRHPESLTPYRYLNAGGWIADAAEFADRCRFLRVADIADGTDDQAYWQRVLIERPGAIALDYGARIVQNLHAAEGHVELTARGVRNRLTGSYPCVYHASGHADLSKVDQWLKTS